MLDKIEAPTELILEIEKDGKLIHRDRANSFLRQFYRLATLGWLSGSIQTPMIATNGAEYCCVRSDRKRQWIGIDIGTSNQAVSFTDYNLKQEVSGQHSRLAQILSFEDIYNNGQKVGRIFKVSCTWRANKDIQLREIALTVKAVYNANYGYTAYYKLARDLVNVDFQKDDVFTVSYKIAIQL
jgi:hypothetical protein